ncbi:MULTISPECIES: hypothetical protein [unclassified Bradyrhizobium]|uniref:hypothetical protein n=1 Tax=unclassified Bradyrhizobium TaxID=2631580 RepID=UPI0028E6DD9C|nr:MULTISPECIES: hypothetical protein [unclassified Bradyrhizobium]
MALDRQFRPAMGISLASVAPRYQPLFAFALLSAASCLASLALACATPFAAFAVVAAAMLPQGSALAVIAGAWLVNQGIGFCALGYPIDATTLAWGFAIGAAALAATLLASAALRVLPRLVPAPLALTATLLCAYAAYEFVLLAATPVLGGAAAFEPAIVLRIGLTSMAWLIGLVAVCEAVRLLGSFRAERAL